MRDSDAKRTAELSRWRERILARAKSGLSIRQWCRRNGFTDQQYYYWHRRVREAQLEIPPEASCQLVKFEPPLGRPSSVIPDATKDKIVVKRGPLTIELPVGIGVSFVTDLLRGIEP